MNHQHHERVHIPLAWHGIAVGRMSGGVLLSSPVLDMNRSIILAPCWLRGASGRGTAGTVIDGGLFNMSPSVKHDQCMENELNGDNGNC